MQFGFNLLQDHSDYDSENSRDSYSRDSYYRREEKRDKEKETKKKKLKKKEKKNEADMEEGEVDDTEYETDYDETEGEEGESKVDNAGQVGVNKDGGKEGESKVDDAGQVGVNKDGGKEDGVEVDKDEDRELKDVGIELLKDKDGEEDVGIQLDKDKEGENTTGHKEVELGNVKGDVIVKEERQVEGENSKQEFDSSCNESLKVKTPTEVNDKNGDQIFNTESPNDNDIDLVTRVDAEMEENSEQEESVEDETVLVKEKGEKGKGNEISNKSVKSELETQSEEVEHTTEEVKCEVDRVVGAETNHKSKQDEDIMHDTLRETSCVNTVTTDKMSDRQVGGDLMKETNRDNDVNMVTQRNQECASGDNVVVTVSGEKDVHQLNVESVSSNEILNVDKRAKDEEDGKGLKKSVEVNGEGPTLAEENEMEVSDSVDKNNKYFIEHGDEVEQTQEAVTVEQCRTGIDNESNNRTHVIEQDLATTEDEVNATNAKQTDSDYLDDVEIESSNIKNAILKPEAKEVRSSSPLELELQESDEDISNFDEKHVSCLENAREETFKDREKLEGKHDAKQTKKSQSKKLEKHLLNLKVNVKTKDESNTETKTLKRKVSVVEDTETMPPSKTKKEQQSSKQKETVASARKVTLGEGNALSGSIVESGKRKHTQVKSSITKEPSVSKRKITVSKDVEFNIAVKNVDNSAHSQSKSADLKAQSKVVTKRTNENVVVEMKHKAPLPSSLNINVISKSVPENVSPEKEESSENEVSGTEEESSEDEAESVNTSSSSDEQEGAANTSITDRLVSEVRRIQQHAGQGVSPSTAARGFVKTRGTNTTADKKSTEKQGVVVRKDVVSSSKSKQGVGLTKSVDSQRTVSKGMSMPASGTKAVMNKRQTATTQISASRTENVKVVKSVRGEQDSVQVTKDKKVVDMRSQSAKASITQGRTVVANTTKSHSAAQRPVVKGQTSSGQGTVTKSQKAVPSSSQARAPTSTQASSKTGVAKGTQPSSKAAVAKNTQSAVAKSTKAGPSTTTSQETKATGEKPLTKNQMELLELEMRARAIKAMLNKAK